MIQSSPDDEKWAFLLEWDASSLDEKHRLYAKKASHELHIFLFFKDRSHFDLFVRGFLRNKFQKTFVDHWLLGNSSELETYLDNQAWLVTLHPHEVILLLHFLVHSAHPHLSHYVLSLSNYIRARDR